MQDYTLDERRGAYIPQIEGRHGVERKTQSVTLCQP